jgi:hypothetical protein
MRTATRAARPLQGPHRMPHLTVPAGTVLAQAEVMGRHLRIFDDPVGSGQFQQAFSEILDVMRAPVGRPTAIVMATVPGIRAGRCNFDSRPAAARRRHRQADRPRPSVRSAGLGLPSKRNKRAACATVWVYLEAVLSTLPSSNFPHARQNVRSVLYVPIVLRWSRTTSS